MSARPALTWAVCHQMEGSSSQGHSGQTHGQAQELGLHALVLREVGPGTCRAWAGVRRPSRGTHAASKAPPSRPLYGQKLAGALTSVH